MERQLYALGEHSFRKIRERGGVYIDKTMFIARLLEEWGFFFLSRPRRFGKSLFTTTLYEFFKGNRQLFKGLYIDSYPWEWEEFPIVKIDLTGGSYSVAEGLTSKLERILSYNQQEYQVDVSGHTPGEKLDSLIKNIKFKFDKNVIILIDEYEKPLLDSLDKEHFDKYRDELRDFYAVLKENVDNIKFLFITGVTRFGNLNIFSGLNNLQDLSLRDEFSSICGLTEEEIIRDLRPGIERLAHKQNIDFNEAFLELKRNYDGYHFSKELIDIYNPYSLLDCLNKSEIAANWFESGSSSFLINLIKTKNYDLSHIDGVEVPESRLKTIGPDLSDPVPLFYQSGYLTIKSYNRESRTYLLGYPNKEVENFLYRCKTERPKT